MALPTALLILAASVLSAVNQAGAVTYTVGDADNWSSGVNYLAWSQKHNFTVDDALLFSYERGQHNTYEVTEETYRSCDSGKGVIRKYSSGRDVVTLTEARDYWFICAVVDHCLGGMKFGVTVRAGNSTAGVAPAGAPDPGSSGLRPSGEAARRGLSPAALPCLLTAVGLLQYLSS